MIKFVVEFFYVIFYVFSLLGLKDLVDSRTLSTWLDHVACNVLTCTQLHIVQECMHETHCGSLLLHLVLHPKKVEPCMSLKWWTLTQVSPQKGRKLMQQWFFVKFDRTQKPKNACSAFPSTRVCIFLPFCSACFCLHNAQFNDATRISIFMQKISAHTCTLGGTLTNHHAQIRLTGRAGSNSVQRSM